MRHFILVLIALAVATGPAFGHAKLLKADPRSGAQLAKPPQVVRLWFSEELDPKRSSIGVWDGHGRRVDDGKGGVDLNDLDRRSLVARLKPVRPGPYVVMWRAVSADDLNVVKGQVRFAVKR